MGTGIGTVGVARLMTAAPLVFCVLVGAALAAPTRAEAHQKAGRTLIYTDGELKKTRDDHFTYSRRLSPSCHGVEVDRLEGLRRQDYPAQLHRRRDQSRCQGRSL